MHKLQMNPKRSWNLCTTHQMSTEPLPARLSELFSILHLLRHFILSVFTLHHEQHCINHMNTSKFSLDAGTCVYVWAIMLHE